jgi:chromosomal replication initiation ATPase DnaA
MKYREENPSYLPEIVDVICQALSLRREVLFSGRNAREVASARQVICYMLCHYAGASYAQAGWAIRRSRTAAYYNCCAAQKHLDTKDELFMQQWKKILPLIISLKEKITLKMFEKILYLYAVE